MPNGATANSLRPQDAVTQNKDGATHVGSGEFSAFKGIIAAKIMHIAVLYDCSLILIKNCNYGGY